ncbi:hypothetical protein F4677DRAFT_365245 [Hypoxylon crocopeplum]|nr:hypothetical protein F4677DRAFT_365245 [Hypoxylon crocopeplum]
MLPLLPWSVLDIFYHFILAIYLVIFVCLHANRIRSWILTVTDMMNPQTPPRKLFKPSSKTKTPTPAKKQRSATPTPSSARSQSHDVLTPTDTISRSTEAPGILSRGTSEATKGVAGSLEEGKGALERTNSAVKSIAGKPLEALSPSTDDLPEPSNPTDALNSPTDIAKYFTEQGNPEMSSFISALAGKTAHDHSRAVSDSLDSNEETIGDQVETLEPIKQLPRDDTLITSPNERTKAALEETTDDATEKASDITDSMKNHGEGESADGRMAQETADTNDISQDRGFASKTPDLPNPADVSKEAEGTLSSPKEQMLGAVPTNTVGEPDTSHISEEAQVGVSNGKREVNGMGRGGANRVGQETDTAASGAPSDDTRVADNMGKPAHIERRIEIPLPRPKKVVNSPPEPTHPDTRNIAAGLGDANDLPSTKDLRSTDDLPTLPEEMLQDPPEEVLDPSVHSPSSNISAIPQIPKITPIGMAPPPELPRLAHGLGGHVVDDVGNIVDESGKVLGHVTGDLPAMIGRKVADNGEIYGDNEEIIGYVSENFTRPPPPTDIPHNVLGGLKVDHQGNILDTNGNIIGRFNEKAGENDTLAPFLGRSKTDESQTEDSKPQEEKKPKVNAHTGGSPSDIFLDVKSTTDGIQLTIRIPTTFGRQPQDS